MMLVIPPGAVSPLDNVVVGQSFPGLTIATDPNDVNELPRKIANTARLHLQTMSGITTGITASGATISVP